MSIRLKILLIIFSLLVLVGAAFLVYSVNTTENYKRMRRDGVIQTVAFAGEKVNKTIATMERNAVDLANSGKTFLLSPDHTDATGVEIAVENFTRFPAAIGGGIWYEPYRFRPGVRRACYYAFFDPAVNGVRHDPDFADEAYDYHNQPWYLDIAAAVKRNHDTAWSRPYYDDTGTMTLMTTVGAGIYDDNYLFVGMSTVDWEIGHVIAELTAIRPTRNSFVLLASPRDDYVLSNTRESDTRSVGTPLSDVEWYGRIPKPVGSSVEVGPFALDGVDYLAFSLLLDNDWLLSVSIPADEIFAEIDGRNKSFTLIIGLSSLLLFILANWLVSALINGPIQRLIGDVRELGRGNLDVRMDVRRRDELGLLATAFNRMTGDLKVSIEKNVRERAERERIAGELNIATKIQASMLPRTFPPFPERDEFAVYATMQPAREVGGDFYDFFLVDDRRLAVVVADVSGKGVPAALFMVIARTLIKNSAQYGKSPCEVFAAVNNLLCEGNEANMFVTAFMGYLEIATGRFVYVNAGHNPPILRRCGEGYRELPTRPGLVLSALENMEYAEDEIVLAAGDTLFLYTDGVTEAANGTGELYGVRRLLAVADRDAGDDIRDLLASVKADIDAFADGAEQADDITMLALRMSGKVTCSKELAVEAATENLPLVQDFVAGELEAGGCPAKARNQLALVVEEVFVNIARYAYRSGTGMATIRLHAGPEVRLEFMDSGIPYNPLETPEPDVDAPAEERDIGGLGVFMVKKLVDSVEYRRVGERNVLVMRKRVGGSDKS